VTRDYPHWALVLERMSAREMPPKPVPQPPDLARQPVMDWIRAVRAEEIRKNASDPGIVLARRLSNAEYNYTIRDLTGRDLQPTREFPVDPANPAGFDNSGESLTMSSALLNKYLQAARSVADHMVLTTNGIDFSPHPMLVETDREKYAIQNILGFYSRQPTDYADYFQAAWRYRHRAALGKPHATLASLAAETKLSPKYLQMIWQLLEEKDARAVAGRGPDDTREMRADARFRDPYSHTHRHAVRRAGSARTACRIAAAAQLETARIRRASPGERPEGPAQRYRPDSRGAHHSALSRAAPGSRAALGRAVCEGPRRR
jgi:hypothetical protein